ncbi:MAG: ParA family protein [Planctomycetes bacterium]|nr:ParA family protein [Planctomycetota bacterium]
MKVIAIINQKGGVGKTTTVANLGWAVAWRGHSVCLVDLDPQSQLTLHFGIEMREGHKSVYDVLTGNASVDEVEVRASERLWIVPSVMDLAAAESELAATVGREQVLSDILAESAPAREFVIIDCPPSLGLLTLNALAAADEVIIPLQAHFLALQGLSRLLETISLVRRRINPRLRVRGVVLCMFEKQTRLAGEVVADLERFFAAARDTDVPWADASIFKSAIRRNVKLAECPSFGQTIFDYEPNSHGAEDYGALADEFIELFCPAPAQSRVEEVSAKAKVDYIREAPGAAEVTEANAPIEAASQELSAPPGRTNQQTPSESSEPQTIEALRLETRETRQLPDRRDQVTSDNAAVPSADPDEVREPSPERASQG